MTRRRIVVGVLALVAIAVIVILVVGRNTGNDTLTDDFNKGTEATEGLVGNSIQLWSRADRSEPIEFETETDEGTAVSSDDLRGDVVVLNFWYSTCAPCRVEAPFLNAAYDELSPAGVQFLGVNTRDQADQARSFATTFEVEYPSALDADNGNVLFALAGSVPAKATPVTIVLDAEGRVAARIVGQLDSATTLQDIVGDVLAESA